MGLREQGGILHIPLWHILYDFHGPHAKLFALCSSLLQCHEKKPGISESSLSPEVGEHLCAAPDSPQTTAFPAVER